MLAGPASDLRHLSSCLRAVPNANRGARYVGQRNRIDTVYGIPVGCRTPPLGCIGSTPASLPSPLGLLSTREAKRSWVLHLGTTDGTVVQTDILGAIQSPGSAAFLGDGKKLACPARRPFFLAEIG